MQLLASSCPSVCPYGTLRMPTEHFAKFHILFNVGANDENFTRSSTYI